MTDQRANQERFAARLAELRASLGMSLDAVGAAVGVSGETIRNYELGRSAPRSRRVVTLIEQRLEARPGELWALLSGSEAPALPGDDDSVTAKLEAIAHEVRLIHEILQERRPAEPGELPESRRGSHSREHAHLAS